MEFSIDVDSKEFFRKFKGIKDDQLPDAFAKALTRTAEEVRGEMVKRLPGKFTLRTKWYMPGNPWGFNRKAATPTNLTAEIYTRAPWIMGFEEGETRQPAGQVFAVPEGARRTKRGLIAPSQKPKVILHRSTKAAFILPTKSGAGIFWRPRKGERLVKLYALIKKARIRPRLYFEGTARRIVEQQFGANFKGFFEDAVRRTR